MDHDIAYLRRRVLGGDDEANEPLIRAMQRTGALRLRVHASDVQARGWNRPRCGAIRGEARNRNVPRAGTPLGPTSIVSRDPALVTCESCLGLVSADASKAAT